MKLLWKQLSGQNGHEAGLELLEELYGAPLPPIEKAKRGKPYFADSSAHFSVSHTKNHVFCVLSDHPIGIDAEEADRDINLNLARNILSPNEQLQFESATDKRRALLTFWVLKEAYVKCTGEGLTPYPKCTDFSLSDPRVSEIDGCLVAVIEQENPYVI